MFPPAWRALANRDRARINRARDADGTSVLFYVKILKTE
jgi:hypothetical protein